MYNLNINNPCFTMIREQTFFLIEYMLQLFKSSSQLLGIITDSLYLCEAHVKLNLISDQQLLTDQIILGNVYETYFMKKKLSPINEKLVLIPLLQLQYLRKKAFSKKKIRYLDVTCFSLNGQNIVKLFFSYHPC